MSSETWPEQVARLELMASDGGDWDLSDNDRAALRAALDVIAQPFDQFSVRQTLDAHVKMLAATKRERDSWKGAAQGCEDSRKCVEEELKRTTAERDRAMIDGTKRLVAALGKNYDLRRALRAIAEPMAINADYAQQIARAALAGRSPSDGFHGCCGNTGHHAQECPASPAQEDKS